MEELKIRMTEYWTERAAGFSDLRQRELNSVKHQRWMEELRRYLPQDRPLTILDLGTGTGFFCFLLAAEGHRMTGIDLTAEMIQEARRTAEKLGIPAEFFVMDAESPMFPDGSFDAIVTRNLTWGLPHLEAAYGKWFRLLKPGGILVNFDADYCREQPPESLPEHHAHSSIPDRLMQEYQRFKEELRPVQLPRPEWDAKLLKKAGFVDIIVDTQVWQRIYAEQDEFYNPTPIFTIAARRPEKGREAQ